MLGPIPPCHIFGNFFKILTTIPGRRRFYSIFFTYDETRSITYFIRGHGASDQLGFKPKKSGHSTSILTYDGRLLLKTNKWFQLLVLHYTPRTTEKTWDMFRKHGEKRKANKVDVEVLFHNLSLLNIFLPQSKAASLCISKDLENSLKMKHTILFLEEANFYTMHAEGLLGKSHMCPVTLSLASKNSLFLCQSWHEAAEGWQGPDVCTLTWLGSCLATLRA